MSELKEVQDALAEADAALAAKLAEKDALSELMEALKEEIRALNATRDPLRQQEMALLKNPANMTVIGEADNG